MSRCARSGVWSRASTTPFWGGPPWVVGSPQQRAVRVPDQKRGRRWQNANTATAAMGGSVPRMSSWEAVARACAIWLAQSISAKIPPHWKGCCCCTLHQSQACAAWVDAVCTVRRGTGALEARSSPSAVVTVGRTGAAARGASMSRRERYTGCTGCRCPCMVPHGTSVSRPCWRGSTCWACTVRSSRRRPSSYDET